MGQDKPQPVSRPEREAADALNPASPIHPEAPGKGGTPAPQPGK